MKRRLLAFMTILYLMVGIGVAFSITGTALAAAKPIAPTNAATGSCPSGDSFTKGDKTTAPSCYKTNPPKGDCPAPSVWKSGSNGLTPNTCVSPGDDPTSSADCYTKGGYEFQQATGLGVAASCTFQPNNNDCPSGTHFVPPGALETQGTCVSNVSSPRNQADCSPSGLIYQAANSGGLVPASCAKPSQAADTYCKDQSGSNLTGCLVGYDAQDCSSFTGSVKTECTKATAAYNTAQGNGSVNSTPTCDTFQTNALAWIICPVAGIMIGFISFFNSVIVDQSNIQADAIFCNNNATCTDYYNAWSSFRDIALGLMAITGLLVVIAQALGMEILDAYTIRKVLPGILIAAIGITLSWALMRFLVQLSDDLGFGIKNLMELPFSGLSGGLNLTISNNAVFNTVGGAAATIAVGAVLVPAWLFAGGFGALLSILGTAMLAVLVAFLTLTIRQVVVVILILVAPIAIVCYILPNTQRVYKFWWESFIKALLMFPMIAALIAAGDIFSRVVINENGGTPGVNQLIGFIAYCAPYFMIPFTFKFAGSIMGAAGNFVNSGAQPARGALSKYRAGQRASRLERVRARGLYRDDDTNSRANRLRRGLNKVGFYSLDLDEQAQMDIGTGQGIGRLTGRAGKKLLGRTAGVMAQEKALLRNQHIAKGAEKTHAHYTAAWAGMGMFDEGRAGQGLTAQGRAALAARFGGFDEQGRLLNAPKSYQDFKDMGEILRGSGNTDAGSNAAMAGQHLTEGVAAKLTSFAHDPETARASAQSVLAFSAARDGKLNAEDLADLHNRAVDGHENDPVAMAFAQQEMSQLETVATQQRPDLAVGKGIRHDERGHAYSVYGSDSILQPDGSRREAYKTKEAYDSVTSRKGGALTNAKADTIKEMSKTIASIANGKHPENFGEGPAAEAEAAAAQQSMIRMIEYGAVNPYSDIDQQTAWRAIITENPDLGITPERLAAAEARARREAEDHAGADGAAPTETPPPPA